MAFKKFGPREGFAKGPLGGRGEGWSPRQMFKGNWKCADCGVEITELPFEPSPDRPIYCKECWTKRRTERFRR